MDPSGLGVDAIFVIAFATLGWYIPGSLLQRRASRRYVRLLGAAAEALADREKPTLRWLGASGFQIIAASVRAPFKKASLVAVLLPREALLLWLVALARGRGDAIVARADLRIAPRRQLEAYRGSPPKDARLGEAWGTWNVDGMVVRGNALVDGELATRLRDALGPNFARARRVSVAAGSPHVIVELHGASGDGTAFAVTLAEIGRIAEGTPAAQ